MKKYTHISFSVGIGSISLSLFSIFVEIGFIFYFLLFVFILIARIPDFVDHTLYREHKRRFLTHSPLSPLLIGISIILGLLFSFINLFLGVVVAIVIYLVFLSHCFLDALNPSGIPILRRRIMIKSIPYDNIKWNILFFIIGAGIAILGLFWFIILNI